MKQLKNQKIVTIVLLAFLTAVTIISINTPNASAGTKIGLSKTQGAVGTEVSVYNANSNGVIMAGGVAFGPNTEVTITFADVKVSTSVTDGLGRLISGASGNPPFCVPYCATTGVYEVRATGLDANGVVIYGAKTFSVTSIPVEPTSVSVSCNPATLHLDGATHFVTISGYLTSNGAAMTSKTISLYYDSGTGIFQEIAQTTTSYEETNGGAYSYSWEVPILTEGFHSIKAEYSGDGTYVPCEDQTLLHQDNGLFVAPEYNFGALLALVACFAALVIVKKSSALRAVRK